MSLQYTPLIIFLGDLVDYLLNFPWSARVVEPSMASSKTRACQSCPDLDKAIAATSYATSSVAAMIYARKRRRARG